jgi:hypothetical protein
MVISGYSTYFENYCDDGKCIPLPNGDDENGFYWGSTSNVDNAIATVTGWRDFVIHHDGNNNLPVNHPDYTGGWATQKRALCGIEL